MYRHLERCRLERAVSAHGGVRLIEFAVRVGRCLHGASDRPRGPLSALGRALALSGATQGKLDKGLAPCQHQSKDAPVGVGESAEGRFNLSMQRGKHIASEAPALYR